MNTWAYCSKCDRFHKIGSKAAEQHKEFLGEPTKTHPADFYTGCKW